MIRPLHSTRQERHGPAGRRRAEVPGWEWIRVLNRDLSPTWLVHIHSSRKHISDKSPAGKFALRELKIWFCHWVILQLGDEELALYRPGCHNAEIQRICHVFSAKTSVIRIKTLPSFDNNNLDSFIRNWLEWFSTKKEHAMISIWKLQELRKNFSE